MLAQKIILAFFFACALLLGAKAQTPPPSLFHPIAQVGVANGSRGASPVVQAVAGFDLKPLYIGAGTGIDYYRLRSIPLFATLRKDLGKVRKPAFLYADMGYHFDWLTEQNLNESRYGNNYNYSGGLYYEFGIGGRLNGRGQKTGFTLSAGYSRKNMKQTSQVVICPFVGPCNTNNETIRYNLSRLLIKAGWIF